MPTAHHLLHRAKSFRLTRLRPARIFIVAGALILLAAAALAIPTTRYGLLGWAVKHPLRLTIIDAQTGLAVSKATINLDGAVKSTDANGSVTFAHVRAGFHQLIIQKAYYEDGKPTVKVGLTVKQATAKLSLKATGRTVVFDVVNAVSGLAVAHATVAAGNTTSLTDDHGRASLVLPPQPAEPSTTISADGFNSQSVVVKLAATMANRINLVPSGKVYFLDKRSGTVNVAKTDLDGGNYQVVVTGSKHDYDNEVALLSSASGNYYSLLSRRQSDNQPRLYLIDAKTDQLSLIDEGKNAYFTTYGWLGDHLVYQVSRPNAIENRFQQIALKSFDAPSHRITLIDQTEAQSTYFNSNTFVSNSVLVQLVGSNIVYSKFWDSYGYWGYGNTALQGRSSDIFQVKADGSGRTTLYHTDASAYHTVSYRLDKPNRLLCFIGGNWDDGVAKPMLEYGYSDGKFTLISSDSASSPDVTGASPGYLISPSGKLAWWVDTRNGKYTHLMSDISGANQRTIADATDYIALRWLSDDYLLLSKKSQLYIVGRDFKQEPHLISSYHNPLGYYPGGGD